MEEADRLLHTHAKEPRERSDRWIEAFRRIPVQKKFELHLDVEFTAGREAEEECDLEDTYQEVLSQLLRPYSLLVGTTDDVEDDLGIWRLFE